MSLKDDRDHEIRDLFKNYHYDAALFKATKGEIWSFGMATYRERIREECLIINKESKFNLEKN